MEINLLDKSVNIWLTKEEKLCEETQKKVDSLIEKYAKEKYFVTVYISGNGDLITNTSDLLCYNLEVSAMDMSM